MAADSYRCFIAVELSPPALELLGRAQSTVQSALVDDREALRWVRPEGIHLTLKFLGSASVEQLPAIEDALRARLAQAARCTVTIGGLGMFPGRTRPRVIWVGVGGELDRLAEVQRQVELATVPLGFPSEQRAFSPHLTLARAREELDPTRRRELGLAVAALRVDASVELRVEEISLMRSEIRRGGAIYSRLAAVTLRGER